MTHLFFRVIRYVCVVYFPFFFSSVSLSNVLSNVHPTLLMARNHPPWPSIREGVGRGYRSCLFEARTEARSSFTPLHTRTLRKGARPSLTLYTHTHSPPSLAPLHTHTAAAAKSLRLCLTLCDPIDGSPPGSPIPGTLQARTLEWVAISFPTA